MDDSGVKPNDGDSLKGSVGGSSQGEGKDGKVYVDHICMQSLYILLYLNIVILATIFFI